MVHLHDINIEVLARILDYAIGSPPKNISDWKPKLRLLHVCSLWTDIAKPPVFNNGFIELELVSYRRFGRFSKAIPRIKHASNLDIITGHDYHTHVQSLNICAVNAMKYSDFAKHTIDILKPDKFEWIFVKSLTIDLFSRCSIDAIPSEVVYLPEIIETFVKNVHMCLPRVKNLSISEHNNSYRTISNMLSNKYMHQLHSLSSECHIDFKLYAFCSNLTALSFDHSLYRKALDLPYLRAAQLQIFEVFGIPTQFSWDAFYDADGRDIVFSNLTKLSIHYKYRDNIYSGLFAESANNDVKPTYYRLHFPKLEHLSIIDCPPGSELHNCHKYFRFLKSAELGNHVELIMPFINNRLHAKDTLTIRICDIGSVDRFWFYETSNYIFGNTSSANSIYLSFNSNIDFKDFQHIEWPNVTRLFIERPLDVDLYICFLARLPNLNVAETVEPYLLMTGAFKRIGLANGFLQSPPTISNKRSFASKIGEISYFIKNMNKSVAHNQKQFLKWAVSYVKPLNSSKLEFMILHSADKYEFDPNMIMVVCYIIVRFPLLKKIFLGDELKSVEHLVEKLKPHFPWLKRLEIRYFDRDDMDHIARMDDLAEI